MPKRQLIPKPILYTNVILWFLDETSRLFSADYIKLHSKNKRNFQSLRNISPNFYLHESFFSVACLYMKKTYKSKINVIVLKPIINISVRFAKETNTVILFTLSWWKYIPSTQLFVKAVSWKQIKYNYVLHNIFQQFNYQSYIKKH